MKKQITIPGFIYAQIPEDWNYGGADVIDGVYYRFSVYESRDKTPIAAINLTFDAPEHVDVTAGFVAELRRQKQKLMADFQARCTEIEKQISQLTALTCETA